MGGHQEGLKDLERGLDLFFRRCYTYVVTGYNACNPSFGKVVSLSHVL